MLGISGKMNVDCTWLDPLKKASSVSIIRRMSMETYMVRVYTGPLSPDLEYISVEAEKVSTAEDVVTVAIKKLSLGSPEDFELAEVVISTGQVCKERRLEGSENPVRIQLIWPKINTSHKFDSGFGMLNENRFYIRKKNLDNVNRTLSWQDYSDPNPVENFLTTFLRPPTSNKEYPDLCNLPDLNERTLLENIKSRYSNSNIYTYVGSILIAVNPFKFFPIYNPKYVKMYQNKRLGDLPPHIFAVADAAFHTMLRNKQNQCIVISGESGSGKTESTNLLLHHLTALSHKGLHGSGVEQTILGAGPVLEAFGNAKTVHNNNSSRFGKFIQVNYKENGMVHGAIVEKYLLEKSRIVSQAKNERNYHVFYYLLQGASDVERHKLFLGKPEDYFYLNQSDCYHLEEVDEGEEYRRLKQSMEMVGFSGVTQARIVGVLSAVLYLGNVAFRKKADQYHDESVSVLNKDTIQKISSLLKVKEKILEEALTQKKATAGGETVVMNYKMEDAVATRDAMAKCLYGALFDWIVLKVNQALLAKKHNSEHQGHSIGVLDIFGFEDFSRNSFEQFCINYANEHLQYYFNQHIFKFEQEEYEKEGIQWKNIEFIDNTGCLELFSKRGTGLFALLDEECNFPGASNDTLLSKFHHHHSKGRGYYEAPQKRELSFAIFHYAGKVKYTVKDFREKNSDQIRTDIVGNFKSSSLSFVRELMGVDPVAVLRWTIIKTLIKSMFAFIKAGSVYRKRGGPDSAVLARRKQSQQDHLNIPDVLGRDSFLNPRTPSPTSRRSPRSPMHDNRYSRHLVHDLSERQTPAGSLDEEDDVFLRRCSGPLKSPVDPYLSEDEVIVMRKAEIVLMKNKSFKPKSRPQTMFSDIKTLKAIANRTMFGGAKTGSRMQPPSVGAQFQWSLSRLMETLNKANPFFIRCIKSNAEKAPCKFNDELVMKQLRYTGMLATVRIRQSGYNYRLTFEEFIQLYKILLPKGLSSGKDDVQIFLEKSPMNQENFQIGISKVFLRENEKCMLDEQLHYAIMKRVVCIQRYVKTKVERKNFIMLRESVQLLQKYIRGYLARQRLVRFNNAIMLIQRWFRGARERRKYRLVRCSAIRIQSHLKAHLQRKRFKEKRLELEQQRKEEEERLQQEALERSRLKSEDMASFTSDEGVLIKDNSADELEIPKVPYERRDSEESSGILDDSESDTLSDTKSRGESVSTPPPTPTSGGPEIIIQGMPGDDDTGLSKLRRKSRVDEIIKKIQSPESQPYSDAPDGRSPTGTIFIRRGSARKRPPKLSTAPLAKQESFSDMESPPSDKISPLSPDKIKKIEQSLKPPYSQKAGDADQSGASPIRKVIKKGQNIFIVQETLRETKSYPCAELTGSLRRKFSSPTLNLLRRTKSSIKILRDRSTGSRKKKDSTAEDSDDEGEGTTVHPSGGKNKAHYEPQKGQVWHAPVSRAPRRPQDMGIQVLPTLIGEPLSPRSPDGGVLSGDEEEHPQRSIKKKRASNKHPDKDRPVETQKGWTVAKTSQWQYPEEWKITEVYELQLLDEFINRKINILLRDMKQESLFDKVFSKCLQSFHRELKSTLSVHLQAQKDYMCNIRYRDLFANFELTMNATCRDEKVDESFPGTMVINAFRGFLDEFRNSVNVKKKEKEKEKKRKKPHKKRKREKDTIEHQGHKFSQVQFGIPTFCELCSNIIWIMEKGHVCQVCRYTCHKRCIYKSSNPCRGAQQAQQLLTPLSPTALPTCYVIGPYVYNVIQKVNVMAQRIAGTKVFGVPLASLMSENDKVPAFLENLIMSIELHGLYTEGIYRKAGSANKIKKLKDAIDLGQIDLSIEEYPVHVLTAALKCFLRELPEPLLTFELYDEFLQASEIKDEKETVQVLYSIIERLPKVNHCVFERLIFHLARVAIHEPSNKMSVNGLSIIFAPCLLRTSKNIQAQEMLTQVSKQTICIDRILGEQLNKFRITLQDIKTLESAEVTAIDRLTEVRASMKISKGVTPKKSNVSTPLPEEEDLGEQERVLDSHIQSLRKERDMIRMFEGLDSDQPQHFVKPDLVPNCFQRLSAEVTGRDDLTSNLPVLEYRHSSDDEVLSVDDMDSTGTYETADEMDDNDGGNLESSAKAPYELKPIPKRRSSTPHKLSPKQSRHKDENTSNYDSNKTASSEHVCSGDSPICDSKSDKLTKEQTSSDIQSRTARSGVKVTSEQKQQPESKGPFHGILFKHKTKSSSGKTDFPGKSELSLGSSFNSKEQYVDKEGSRVRESRSKELKDSTPDSSPKLTRPLKFLPGSVEHANVTRYSSYDSTKFNVSPNISDEDEIMV